MWHKNISHGKIQNEWEGLKFPKLRYVFFLYVLFPPQYPWFCNLYVKIMEFLYINTFIHFISELRCSTFQYKKNTFTFIQKSKGIATRAYQLWRVALVICIECVWRGREKETEEDIDHFVLSLWFSNMVSLDYSIILVS